MLKTLHPPSNGQRPPILAGMAHPATPSVQIPGASTDAILEAIRSLDVARAPLAVRNKPAEKAAIYEGFSRIAEQAEGRFVAMEAIEAAEFGARTAQAYVVTSSGKRHLDGDTLLHNGAVRS